MKASEILAGRVYGGTTKGVRAFRKVTWSGSTVDWNPCHANGEEIAGLDGHNCKRSSFARWASFWQYHPEDDDEVKDRCVASPTPSQVVWLNTGDTKTTIGISQENAKDPYTPWYQINVGEVLECDGRLFLAVDPEAGFNERHKDAMSLLDLRSLEVLSDFEVNKNLKLRRVSAEITINVK